MQGIGEKRATYILNLREKSPEPFKNVSILNPIPRKLLGNISMPLIFSPPFTYKVTKIWYLFIYFQLDDVKDLGLSSKQVNYPFLFAINQ